MWWVIQGALVTQADRIRADGAGLITSTIVLQYF